MFFRIAGGIYLKKRLLSQIRANRAAVLNLGPLIVREGGELPCAGNHAAFPHGR